MLTLSTHDHRTTYKKMVLRSAFSEVLSSELIVRSRLPARKRRAEASCLVYCLSLTDSSCVLHSAVQIWNLDDA